MVKTQKKSAGQLRGKKRQRLRGKPLLTMSMAQSERFCSKKTSQAAETKKFEETWWREQRDPVTTNKDPGEDHYIPTGTGPFIVPLHSPTGGRFTKTSSPLPF